MLSFVDIRMMTTRYVETHFLQCKQESRTTRDMRSGTCRMSGKPLRVRHACAAGTIWCSWIGSKSLQRYRLRQPCASCWFFRPRLSDLVAPRVCLSIPTALNRGHPRLDRPARSVSAKPGVPIPRATTEFLFQAVIPQHWRRAARVDVTSLTDSAQIDDAPSCSPVRRRTSFGRLFRESSIKQARDHPAPRASRICRQHPTIAPRTSHHWRRSSAARIVTVIRAEPHACHTVA